MFASIAFLNKRFAFFSTKLSSEMAQAELELQFSIPAPLDPKRDGESSAHENRTENALKMFHVW